MKRRERGDGSPENYGNYDRGYPSDNNFDRSYDSTAYGGRQHERDYNDNNNYQGGRDDNSNYQGNRDNNYRDPRGNGYNAPPQRRVSEPQYRPLEEMQLHQREAVQKIAEVKSQDMGGANNVVVSYPNTYQEVKQLIDSMRLKQAIIIDIIKLDTSDAQRVLDFLSGANYALGGSMQRLSATMFLFTPGGVPIKVHYDVNKR